MNWKGYGRKLLWPSVRYTTIPVLAWRTEENYENLSQNTWFSGRDMNRKPPEYDAGVLTTRP
jgi:hypothetical protein